MRQPCDLLQQVPGSSSSSRHQRSDRQSRGGKDDQGDFFEEGKEVWYTALTMTMIKYRLFTLFDSGIRRLDLCMDIDMDGIQVHSFDDVAGYAHMLDQSPLGITPDSSLGDSFQTACPRVKHRFLSTSQSRVVVLSMATY
jgi:hypothetical protein